MASPQTQQSNPTPAAAPEPAAITPAEQKRLGELLETVIEKTAPSRGIITLTPQGVEFGNFEGVQRYAKVLLEAGVVPPKMNLAQAIIAIMLGRRVGIAPEEAVQSIFVVNNRAQMFSDAPLAVCRQHKDWVESGFEEFWVVGGKEVGGTPPPEALKQDGTAAVCKTLRRGAARPRVSEFSVAHAKQAGLWGKNGGLYGAYPQRMLLFRARGYNLRDNFGDALKGIAIAELQDTPPEPETAEPPVGRQSLRGGPPANGNAHDAESERRRRHLDSRPAEEPAPAPAIPVSKVSPEDERQDAILALREQIREAASAEELPEELLERNRAFLGQVDHNALLAELRERKAVLAREQTTLRGDFDRPLRPKAQPAREPGEEG